MVVVKQAIRERARMIEENAGWLEKVNRENFVITNKELFESMIEQTNGNKSVMTNTLGSILGTPDQAITRRLQRGLNYGLFVRWSSGYQLSSRGEKLFEQLRSVSI